MIFAAIVGIANYAIYMATIDYMICAYGPYSASATGGNGWSRDFLAGVLTVPATPFFENIGASSGKNLEYACTILFCISFVLVSAVYVIYWKGPVLRKRSPFAQQLAEASKDSSGRRPSIVSHSSRHQSVAGYSNDNSAWGSRRGSMAYVRRGTGSRTSSFAGGLGGATGGAAGIGADPKRPQGQRQTSRKVQDANRRWAENEANAV
jgi:hypothetical protein